MTAYASKDTETAKLEQRRSQAMLRIYFNYGGWDVTSLLHCIADGGQISVGKNNHLLM